MLREFGRYVADERRTELLARAVGEVVAYGDVVVDLGAGFGLLALLAARQGAARVYAIEQGPYLGLAHAIAQDNKLAERIIWVEGNSARVVLPELADVIISETLGQLALEEFTVEYLYDARRRLAKPHARLMPLALRLYLEPLESPGLRARWLASYGPQWADVAGFDLSRLRQAVVANEALPYIVYDVAEADKLLGPRTEIISFSLGTSQSSKFLRRVACGVELDGQLDAVLATFDAQLSASVVLSTHPTQPRTHWRNVVFPVVPALPVRAGQVVQFEFGFHGTAGWSFAPLSR